MSFRLKLLLGIFGSLAVVLIAILIYFKDMPRFSADTIKPTTQNSPSLAGLTSSLLTASVSAKSNIFMAGQTTSPLPTRPGDAVTIGAAKLNLPANTTSLTFNSVTGLTNCVNKTPALGPNGGTCNGYSNVNINSYQGISGIKMTGKTMFLTGVFTKDTKPVIPAPATVDYTNSFNLANMSPALNQVFPVGSGKTLGGASKVFQVPAGATKLWLGFVDGGTTSGFTGDNAYYSDNTGLLNVAVLPVVQSNSLYTITPYSTSGGSISPSTPQQVSAGLSLNFDFSPKAGYSVANVFDNGISVFTPNMTHYLLNNITSNHNITVDYNLKNDHVTATLTADKTVISLGEPVRLTWSSTNATKGCEGPGGDSTNGSTIVYPQYDFSQYNIACIGGTGGAYGGVAGSSVMITVKNAPPKPPKYTIATSASPAKGGNIEGIGTEGSAGSFTSNAGDNPILYFTPSSGYGISSIVVNGVPKPASFAYSFNNIKANQIVKVNFGPIYTITPSVSTGGGTITTLPTSGGTITPSVPQNVLSGESKTFTIIPKTGYLSDVWVDNVNLHDIKTYTFNGVIANHTIRVVFTKAADPYISFFSATPLTAFQTVSVKKGQKVNISWTSVNADKCIGQQDTALPSYIQNFATNVNLPPSSTGTSFIVNSSYSTVKSTTFWIKCFNSTTGKYSIINPLNKWKINVLP